jgi:hypothetical protein
MHSKVIAAPVGTVAFGRPCFAHRPSKKKAVSTPLRQNLGYYVSMKLLKMLSKPAAWGSGWTSAILCFSAATGYWLAGERRRAICWIVLGTIEVGAIVL